MSVPVFSARLYVWARTCVYKTHKDCSALKLSLLPRATFGFQVWSEEEGSGKHNVLWKRSLNPTGLVHRDGDTQIYEDRRCCLAACHAQPHSPFMPPSLHPRNSNYVLLMSWRNVFFLSSRHSWIIFSSGIRSFWIFKLEVNRSAGPYSRW